MNGMNKPLATVDPISLERVKESTHVGNKWMQHMILKVIIQGKLDKIKRWLFVTNLISRIVLPVTIWQYVIEKCNGDVIPCQQSPVWLNSLFYRLTGAFG